MTRRHDDSSDVHEGGPLHRLALRFWGRDVVRVRVGRRRREPRYLRCDGPNGEFALRLYDNNPNGGSLLLHYE